MAEPGPMSGTQALTASTTDVTFTSIIERVKPGSMEKLSPNRPSPAQLTR
jgi:hypothetical protein